jgi:hypothetical protein
MGIYLRPRTSRRIQKLFPSLKAKQFSETCNKWYITNKCLMISMRYIAYGKAGLVVLKIWQIFRQELRIPEGKTEQT